MKNKALIAFIKPPGKRYWKHGHTGGLNHTKTYRTWRLMKERCHNPNRGNYRYYGGRGITICERWRSSFVDFVNDMGLRPDGCTIERLDNNGNYEPGNCIWADKFRQAENRRDRRVIEIDGAKKIISQWARERGMKIGTIWMRLNTYGWNERDAVMTPVQ